MIEIPILASHDPIFYRFGHPAHNNNFLAQERYPDGPKYGRI
jgi:hypothetical protein